jgi:hypothetical protein
MEKSEILIEKTEPREMSLEKALETIKQINDRHELQLKLTEAARRERPTEA